MEQHTFEIGLIQFSVFFIVSIITLLVTFWFIKRFVVKKYQIEGYNTAYGIVSGGIVFSVFYLISALITPITSTLNLLDGIFQSRFYVFESAKHISVLLIVALVLAFIICFIAINLVKRFYKGLKLFEEIKNNHIGFSIIIAVVLVSLSLSLRDSLQIILDSFVPYPKMPNLLN